MAQQDTAIVQLFSDLNKYAANQEFERALKTSNKILQATKDDELACHCKIVSLIQLNRFDEALSQIRKSSAGQKFTFEKAYCEYRLNRTQDALQTLRVLQEPDFRHKELLAQILYKLEQYTESYDLYLQLVKNSQDEFDEERETNMAAVVAAIQSFTQEDAADPGLRDTTYELCYNRACYMLGRGECEEALGALRKSTELCRVAFEDEPEDLEEELAIIRVQEAYALQRLGRESDAMQNYNSVLKNRPDDACIVAVASNNVVAINKDQNVFDSKKKMRNATSEAAFKKLCKEQRRAIDMNHCLLLMYSNQGVECLKSAKLLEQKYPTAETPALVTAAQCLRDKKPERAAESLKVALSGRGVASSLQLRLSLAQLYLSQGHMFQACDLLRDMGDLSFRPGLVSALVSIYMSQEAREQAAEVLEQAVDWYSHHEPDGAEQLSVQQAAVAHHLQHGSPQLAARLLEQLRRKKPDDSNLMAQLIAAYSRYDPAKAQELSRQLPSATELASQVDVVQLESSFSAVGPRYVKKTTKGETSPKPTSPDSRTPQTTRKSHKKKKKGKLPKNLDATVDEERWLPRKERSYYRGRRRDKRRTEIGKGTQGAAAASADLDASKPQQQQAGAAAAATPESPKPQAEAAAAVPKQPQKKPQPQQKKKKKGKSGKW